MPPSRKNMESTAQAGWFLPIGVIVVGVFVIVALLLSPAESPQAQTDLQPQQAAQSQQHIELQQDYPEPTENADGPATLTAQAYPEEQTTSTPTDEPEEEEEEEDTDDDQPSSGSGSGSVFDTDTPSPTPSDTGTPTETRTPRPTGDAEAPTPTDTQPTVPDAEADILTCIPGEPTFIQGTGPPNTAVVLWFDDLQVGGASTDSTGFYRVPITAGISRADTFLIEVKTRERRLLVGEALCEVNTTPSPVPALQLAPEAPTALVLPTPVNPPPGVQNTSVPQTVPGAGVELGSGTVDLSGSGQTVTDPLVLPSNINRIAATHNGTSNFQITAIPTGNGREELLVNEIGSYQGTSLLLASGDYFFEIGADGAWTLQIEAVPINSQPQMEISGSGDFVSDLFTPDRTGSVPYTFTHDGQSNFQVALVCNGQQVELAQNEIGNVDNQAVIDFPSSATCLWEVVADGNWTVQPRE